MNNIENEDGSIGSHLKIIRDKFDTLLSWDSTASNVNSGYGVNEWSTSAIETVLNNEYLNKIIGTNLCYKGSKKTTETCPDWSNIGIKERTRPDPQIVWKEKTFAEKWNSDLYNDANKFNVKNAYEAERSSHNGKEGCYGNTYCNDTIDRNATWTGKVGLMYLSDYGYAVGGNVREACLSKTMSSYSSGGCNKNNWLNSSATSQWTLITIQFDSDCNRVLYVHSNGNIANSYASVIYAIRPTLYLKSDVKIALNTADDYGSVDNPFVLEYSEN